MSSRIVEGIKHDNICEVCLFFVQINSRREEGEKKEEQEQEQKHEQKTLIVNAKETERDNDNMINDMDMQKRQTKEREEGLEIYDHLDLTRFSTAKESKYKCPKCKIKYCSLNCFKLHRLAKYKLCQEDAIEIRPQANQTNSQATEAIDHYIQIEGKEPRMIINADEDVRMIGTDIHLGLDKSEVNMDPYGKKRSNSVMENLTQRGINSSVKEIDYNYLHGGDQVTQGQGKKQKLDKNRISDRSYSNNNKTTTNNSREKEKKEGKNTSLYPFPLPMVISDVDEEGPPLTEKMKDILSRSKYIQEEIKKDPTLLSLLKDISYTPSDKRVNVLLKVKKDFPQFDFFVDKMLKEIGVLKEDGTFFCEKESNKMGKKKESEKETIAKMKFKKEIETERETEK